MDNMDNIDSKPVRDFTAVCRSVYINRGVNVMEFAILECAKQCVANLGEEAKIEGISTTALPDQTVLVTVLASRVRQEQQTEE